MNRTMHLNRNATVNDEKIMEKGDKRIAIALISQNVMLMVQYFILFAFSIDGTSISNSVQLASKIIVGLIFMSVLPIVWKRNFLRIYLVYVLAGTVFIFHYLLFYDNQVYLISLLFGFFGICLPSFLYAYSIKDRNIMSAIMLNMSHITLGIGTLISYLVLFRGLSIGTYSMSFSYYLLLPSLVFLNRYLTGHSLKYILLFVLSTAQITVLGSRGALLSISLYIILWLLVNLKSTFRELNARTIVFNFSLLIAITVFAIFYNEIIRIFYDKLTSMGIYSRTLDLFLSDEIYMSGRDTQLYSIAVNIISINPLMGTGIASDRLYLGNYVHNLFLELAMDFGVIVSFTVSIALIGLFIKTIILVEKRTADFILIFFCLGVVPLMVSSSYLIDSWFWIYLGLAINIFLKETPETVQSRNRNKKTDCKSKPVS